MLTYVHYFPMFNITEQKEFLNMLVNLRPYGLRHIEYINDISRGIRVSYKTTMSKIRYYTMNDNDNVKIWWIGSYGNRFTVVTKAANFNQCLTEIVQSKIVDNVNLLYYTINGRTYELTN